MKFHGLTLDKFQEDAIESLNEHHSVIISAPTGSGKTLLADYIIEKAIHEQKKIIYTAPIKALSNQKYHDFSKEYGEDKIGLLTGDEVINKDAQILIMTTEVYRNMVVSKTLEMPYYVVFDEIHYINDVERGTIWEESIIFSPKEVRFLCLSATIPNSEEFAGWIESIKDHKVDVILHHKRSVPLKLSFYDEELGITTLKKIAEVAKIPSYNQIMGKRGKRGKGGDKRKELLQPNHLHLIKETETPCLFFCFSRKKTEKYAQELAREIKQVDPEIKRYVSKKLSENEEIRKFPSTKALREVLSKGIAFHHAGVLPFLKEMVEELFAKGKIKYLYATETFAVGINMPAKTVCFEGFRKFNGIDFGMITSKEFFQMAGRAGRRGIDEVGYVIPMINRRNFDYKKIFNLTDSDKDPLVSKYKLSTSSVLNLMDQHNEEEINKILKDSYFIYQNKQNYNVIKRRFDNMVKKLHKIGFLYNNKLTDDGRFAANLFVDEIVLTKIFNSDEWKRLSSYQIILIITALVYEPRMGNKFYKKHITKIEKDLYHHFKHIMYDQADHIKKLSSIVYTIFRTGDFFEVMQPSSLTEGDLIRLFSQVMDRLNQLMNATNDIQLEEKLSECYGIIHKLIEEVS